MILSLCRSLRAFISEAETVFVRLFPPLESFNHLS